MNMEVMGAGLSNSEAMSLPYDDLQPFIEDANGRMNGAIEAALKALGEEVPESSDPRVVATEKLKALYKQDSGKLLRLSAMLWRPNVLCEYGESGAVDGVLTPREIERMVTIPLYRLLVEGRMDEAISLMERFPSKGPIGYIKHMDGSLHGVNTAETTREVLMANGRRFVGSTLEIGAGPGNIVWRMDERDLLPDGDILVVDTNRVWTDYSERLIGERMGRDVTALNQSAESIGRDAGSVGSIFTALTLQWFEKPNASIVEAARLLSPDDGNFVIVGETPVNATGNTPSGLSTGLDIGFSNGAFRYAQICRMAEDAGLQPLERAAVISMAMPRTPEAVWERVAEGDRGLARLMQAYSDHVMIGAGFTK